MQLWFADSPEDAYEDPTFHRSRSHDYVAQEVKAVRENLGASEIANFANHKFTGSWGSGFLGLVFLQVICLSADESTFRQCFLRVAS
jgi:dimethylglycine dehydrogenase